jgi:hypothetical protein
MTFDYTCIHWYNFKSGEYEIIKTPQDFHDYIPQHPFAQSLYDVYIEMGDKPIEAARKVLLVRLDESK